MIRFFLSPSPGALGLRTPLPMANFPSSQGLCQRVQCKFTCICKRAPPKLAESSALLRYRNALLHKRESFLVILLILLPSGLRPPPLGEWRSFCCFVFVVICYNSPPLLARGSGCKPRGMFLQLLLFAKRMGTARGRRDSLYIPLRSSTTSPDSGEEYPFLFYFYLPRLFVVGWWMSRFF